MGCHGPQPKFSWSFSGFWLQVRLIAIAFLWFVMAMPVAQDVQHVVPVPLGKENPLKGFCTALEGDKEIRKFGLRNQALLQWLSPKHVGVVSNKSLKLNASVLEILLHKWCPNAPDRKTVPIGWLKLEAGGLPCISFYKFRGAYCSM